MSQNIHRNQSRSAPVAEPIHLEFGPIVADVDKLMDELFLEIEKILDSGCKLPTTLAAPEYDELSPLQVSEMTLPLTRRGQEPLTQQPRNPPNGCETPVEEDTGVAASHKSLPQGVDSPRLFDKILLGAAVGSMAATLIVWGASQHSLNSILSHNPSSSPVPQKTQISSSDAKFIDYMLLALQAIDRRATAKGLHPRYNLPPGAAAGNITPPYIQNTYTTPPAISTYSNPSPTTTLSPPPNATPPSPTIATTPRATPTASAGKYMLVGLVVQGSQSVAMFNINGKTRQIHLGEKIADTGWILDSVNLNEAIIRHDKDVLSVRFGQKF